MAVVSKKEIEAFLAAEFPQGSFDLAEFSNNAITIRQRMSESDLRPGGTVSGPTIMALADCAIYVAVLREIGLVALAVTTSFNINFLRKPRAGKAIFANCHLLKLGKSLAIGKCQYIQTEQKIRLLTQLGPIPSRQNRKLDLFNFHYSQYNTCQRKLAAS